MRDVYPIRGIDKLMNVFGKVLILPSLDSSKAYWKYKIVDKLKKERFHLLPFPYNTLSDKNAIYITICLEYHLNYNAFRAFSDGMAIFVLVA